MNKKDIAISFLHLASSGKVREAYEKYVHPDFHHHNPYFKGDAQSLMTAMEENAIKDHWLYGCLRRYAELVPAQVEARPESK